MSKSDRARKAEGVVVCVVWSGGRGAGGESARMTVIGGGGKGRGSVSLSVCLGEETKVPVGGMGGKRQTRWRVQRDGEPTGTESIRCVD